MILSNLTYDEQVKIKFPNPDENEYRELMPNDIGRAVHRDNVNKVVNILNWEYNEQRHIRIIDNGLEMIVNAIWYLKPAV